MVMWYVDVGRSGCAGYGVWGMGEEGGGGGGGGGGMCGAQMRK